jgi:hypothetical protein
MDRGIGVQSTIQNRLELKDTQNVDCQKNDHCRVDRRRKKTERERQDRRPAKEKIDNVENAYSQSRSKLRISQVKYQRICQKYKRQYSTVSIYDQSSSNNAYRRYYLKKCLIMESDTTVLQ